MSSTSPPTLTLGCTYWPRRRGPWFWGEGFDRVEIRDELDHIADLGCTQVRLLLPWATFQPQPGRLGRIAFDQFGTILDLAESAGLAVVATVPVGLFYGTRFVPRWLLRASAARGLTLPERGERWRTISDGWVTPLPLQNFYEARDLLDLQRYLLTELAGYFGSHPAVGAWDLGGGDLLAAAPPRGAEAGLHWLDHLAAAVREADPDHPVWYAGQPALLLDPALPRPEPLRRLVAHLGLNAIPYSSSTARGPADHHFVLFMLLLAGTLAETGGQPLACTGTAIPTAAPGLAEQRIESEPEEPDGPPVVDILPAEEVQAEFFEALIPALHAHGVPMLWHAAYADAPPPLRAIAPFDAVVPLRHMGLVRADGQEKVGARHWRQLATHLARGELGTFGRDARPLDVDNDEFWQAPIATLSRWYLRYREGEI